MRLSKEEADQPTAMEIVVDSSIGDAETGVACQTKVAGELIEHMEEAHRLRKENECLRRDNERLQRDNECLQRDNERLQKDNECLQRDNERLQKDNECLQRDSEYLRTKSSKVRKEVEQISITSEALQANKRKLKFYTGSKDHTYARTHTHTIPSIVC